MENISAAMSAAERRSVPGYDPCEEARVMSEANDERLHALARSGAQISGDTILAVKLKAVVEHMLGPLYHEAPNGHRVPNFPRGEFELELARTFSEHIDAWESQIRQAVLLNGVRRQQG